MISVDNNTARISHMRCHLMLSQIQHCYGMVQHSDSIKYVKFKANVYDWDWSALPCARDTR